MDNKEMAEVINLHPEYFTLAEVIELLDRKEKEATLGEWHCWDTGWGHHEISRWDKETIGDNFINEIGRMEDASFVVALRNTYPLIRKELDRLKADNERMSTDLKIFTAEVARISNDADGECGDPTALLILRQNMQFALAALDENTIEEGNDE